MESFCIKTNNQTIIHYLLNKFENIGLEDVYLSLRQFKIYHNFIVHYLGDDISTFYNESAEILTDTILTFYEPILLRRLLNVNYFYFSDKERKQIADICSFHLTTDQTESVLRKNYIYIACLKYLCEHKSTILDGFVNFRLKDYIKLLDSHIDTAVNSFLIEKEYSEFINLLKMYITSSPSCCHEVHLIYAGKESILMDEDNHIIDVSDNIFNAKYLSDISFSSNDYALNSLLTLIPEKITIHIIDQEDEFIRTLKLIFDNRIFICNDCSICQAYKLTHQTEMSTRK